jgi:hypothetical protein
MKFYQRQPEKKRIKNPYVTLHKTENRLTKTQYITVYESTTNTNTDALLICDDIQF